MSSYKENDQNHRILDNDISKIAKMLLTQDGLVKAMHAPVASNYASLVCALLNLFGYLLRHFVQFSNKIKVKMGS